MLHFAHERFPHVCNKSTVLHQHNDTNNIDEGTKKSWNNRKIQINSSRMPQCQFFPHVKILSCTHLTHGHIPVVITLYISRWPYPQAIVVSFDTLLRQAIQTCHSENGEESGEKKGVKTNSTEKSIWLKEWDNERISDNSWQSLPHPGCRI